jgi:uncharacterized repeat protein (TIGR01451 family)
MLGSALVSNRQDRSVLKLSLGISIVAIVLIVGAIFVVGAPEADAAICTWTAGGGGNWTAVASWQQPGCGGTYPGANVGDTATFTFGVPVTVDAVIPNSVTLTALTSPVNLAIPTGSALTLQPSSTITSGNQININGGTLTINTGGTFTSGAPVNLNTGTLTLNGNLSFLGGGNFAFHGGTINGAGILTNPAFTTVPFDGTGGGMTIDGATVDNFGTINFSSSGQSLSINNGGQVTVESGANFNLVQNDPILSNGGGSKIRIRSGGGLSKSGGTSNVISAEVDNDGTIALPTSGLSLTLAGGGTHTGVFTFPNAGSAISFNGTHVFNPSFTWNAPSGATFHLLGGTTTLNWPLTVSTYVQDGGTLVSNGAANSLVASSAMNWNGGSISGNGASGLATSSGTLTIGSAAPTSLDLGAQLEVQGVANDNASAANYLSINTASKVLVDNSPLGTWNFNTTSAIGCDGSAQTIFANSGVVNSGAGVVTIHSDFSQSNFANSALNVTAGTLNLAGTGVTGNTSNGAFNVSPGATLAWTSGAYGLSAGATLNGGGNYHLTGSTFLNNNIALTCPVNFLQDGSTNVNNVGTISIPAGRTYNWKGGSIFGGTTTLSGGSLLIDTGTAGVSLGGGGVLNIGAGTATWSGTNPFTLNQGATINVSGNFNMQATGSMDSVGFTGGTGLGRLRPDLAPPAPNHVNVLLGGAFQKTLNGGQLIIVPDVSNAGTVAVSAGLLALSGPDAVTHTGSFGTAAGAILDFSAGTHTFATGASFTGGGGVKLHGATFDLNPASVSIVNFAFASGTVQGSGNLTTTTQFVWDGGTMSGSGQTTLQGTATLSGANGPMSLQRPLATSSGTTTTYSSPTNQLVVTYPGGSISNSGTFTLNTTQHLGLSGTPPVGTYLFTNNSGATLNGNGTIDFGVSNDGNLNPGTSPGAITIADATNGYRQTSNGVFNVDLAGTTPATQYDVLTVNGPAALAGTLNTNTTYTPANGDILTPLTYTSHTGAFTTTNLNFPGGVYTLTYTPNAVQLAAAITADLGITMTAPPTANAGGPVNYAITVTNNGPSSAATYHVDFSITSGTIISAPAGCTLTATTASCDFGSIGIGAPNAQSFTITADAPLTAGTMTGSATVSTTSALDTNSANNGPVSQSTTVNAAADLNIVKSVLAPGLIAGGSGTYQITVTNAGPSAASNVVISDTQTPPLTLQAITSTGGTCSTLPCTIPVLAAGASETISATYGVPSNASGSVTNTATVTTSTPDPNLGNNTATLVSPIIQKSDVVVTKTGPSITTVGSSVVFAITVTNNGPSDATGVSLDDPTPARLTFVKATGACTAFPCSLGTMTPGQSRNVQATYTVGAGTAPITNTATVTTTSPDPNSGNNSSSVTLTTSCPSTPTNQLPPNAAPAEQTSGILQWTDVGAASYNVFFGPIGSGCQTLFTTTRSTAVRYDNLQGGTTYEWRVEAVTPGCPVRSSTCTNFTTTGSSSNGCPTTPPTLISPLGNTVNGPTTFSWTSVTGAVDYKLFVNGALITTTTSTSFGPTDVANGPVTWSVVAEFDPPCASLTSSNGTYTSCDISSSKPTPSIIAQAEAGQSYQFLWEAVSGALRYEGDESTDPNFATAATQTFTVNGTSMSFQHSVTVPTAFYYRVRAFIGCANAFGPYSTTVRIVLGPVTAPNNPNVSAPTGSNTLIPIVVHINGFADGSFPFTASLDPQQPWLVSVQPSAGILPPEGINLTVFANPDGLPTGTHTGTVIVLVTTPSSGHLAANGVTPVGAPVSISLVTPVTPKPAGLPPPNSLIIPSTGHLDGINSRWASDVRILNTSSQTVHYQVTFTPDDISKGVKQTVIETTAGATTALDDVVKTWYGVGSLGESSNGSLEIRPLDNPAKTGSDDAPNISFTTVASSRTYNAAPNSAAGTLGEFIPAIAFQNFVGKAIDATHAATILSLQQVAQNDAMRTNFGIMEASGQPASVVVSVFNAAGQRLLQVPMSLSGGQHAQLNGFLSQNKISANDARIEVQVVGGDGKITAYASVIDNKSGDPILISGVPLGERSANHFVLPGVADVNTPIAAWRTDMRIFNPTTSPQTATLMFVPVNNGGQPSTTTLTINPGEVKQLDNTVGSLFGLSNIGGAIHVTTATAAPLVISGRTYNLTSNGTFGQLTTAVTAADSIGKGDRPLQILQTENSVRQRTNVGIFETTGKPATVEVTVFLPDSKIAPSTQIPVPANGYFQIPVIQSFGLTNVYNARISMRVVDGDGKISAYGSVIDQVTQDPTYVPAQQ